MGATFENSELTSGYNAFKYVTLALAHYRRGGSDVGCGTAVVGTDHGGVDVDVDTACEHWGETMTCSCAVCDCVAVRCVRLCGCIT